MIMHFSDIANKAGFIAGADGKFNLPATQASADALAAASVMLLSEWVPGINPVEVTLTGPGPMWAYMIIAHALHGRVIKLSYAAPNAEIVIFGHGV